LGEFGDGEILFGAEVGNRVGHEKTV
jgi:hypothetical protein